ncbi:carbon storage regulator CsrA [Clostridium sp. D2Q-11]|uniref:Translational regulator CsrA n=1 Tax=Anaeromonas frigoriresistens TaxID=2683708 RepID=A0A942US34_9FIRM|nr:carbon storage regulator CsrA [Anaeromonas frigoriresistens]MBS4538143.1 carbon storage regulator CsrA [Anaeromonas frigoriresistens]
MLILSRKKEESIIIGDNIEIVVTDIEDGKVKLGIKAPKNIDIHRKEVYKEIQNENKEAANNKQIDINSLKGLFY